MRWGMLAVASVREVVVQADRSRQQVVEVQDADAHTHHSMDEAPREASVVLASDVEEGYLDCLEGWGVDLTLVAAVAGC